MNGTPIVVLALLVAVVAGAVVGGGDALTGGDGADSDPFPTATSTPEEMTETTADSESSGTTDAAAASTPTPPFGFVIENIEECGTTCRNVTTTLTNQQETTAEDITVYSRIFAGRGIDENEDPIWRGEEPVGTLGPGESYTTTRQVELSFQEGLAVQNEDGWITIQTTVETADRTVTFTEQRQVL